MDLRSESLLKFSHMGIPPLSTTSAAQASSSGIDPLQWPCFAGHGMTSDISCKFFGKEKVQKIM